MLPVHQTPHLIRLPICSLTACLCATLKLFSPLTPLQFHSSHVHPFSRQCPLFSFLSRPRASYTASPTPSSPTSAQALSATPATQLHNLYPPEFLDTSFGRVSLSLMKITAGQDTAQNNPFFEVQNSTQSSSPSKPNRYCNAEIRLSHIRYKG